MLKPLTPTIPLLPMCGRMEGHLLMLARVLAAFSAAMRLLERRLRTMVSAGGGLQWAWTKANISIHTGLAYDGNKCHDSPDGRS